MAGVSPSGSSGALNLINQGTSTSVSLASSGALGTAAAGSAAIPIVGTIVGIGLGIVGGILAKHAQKVKQEAATLNGALPFWRQFAAAVVESYNNGEIDAQSAVAYVEQAKAQYYQQVRAIMRGTPKPGGVGIAGYTCNYGKFAPIDPCNGACYIGYYYIEPEALLLENAFNSGKAQQLAFCSVNIRNGDSVPSLQLNVQPTILSVLPASITSQLPDVVKQHPYAFGLGAIALAVIALK